MKVGICQMNTKDDLPQNANFMEEVCKSMAKEGAVLAAFPECSSYLSNQPEKMRQMAQPLDGEIITRFKHLAAENKIGIHNGSFLERGVDGKIYNTSVLINKNGEIEAVYRKIHLYDMDLPGYPPERESDLMSPGNSVIIKETEFGICGFAVCYDLRFPEQFRQMAQKGAEIIFVPAAFALYTGKEHWEILLRARAIENQVYIIAADQTGEHYDGKISNGHSMAVDPWGCVIAQCRQGQGYCIADIDQKYLRRVRKETPYLKHIVKLNGKSRRN